MPTGMIEEIEQTFKPLQGHARFIEAQRLLTIEFINARIAVGTLKRLERYSNYITNLRFVSCELSDSELQTLPELPWVMWLEMKNCRGYTDRGIQKIALMKRLTSILMEGAPIGDDATKVIGQFQTLDTLDLSSTHITDEGLKNLASLSKLTSLNLNRTPITGSGFKYLTRLSKLTTLQLMESKVTDEGLSQMGYHPGPTSIVLDRTAVGDAGLKAIVANVPTIVSLNLNGTQVTDVGVMSLTNLPDCHRVELSKTRVTKLGVDAIKAKFPKIAIAGP
jgi:internalin A